MSTIVLESVPKTVEDFITLRNNLASTPEGGAVVFIVALAMYQENPSVGEQCLVIAVDRSKLSPGSVYKGFALDGISMSRLKEQVKRYPYIANSYFKGATPENGYKTILPTSVELSENAHSGDRSGDEFKVFVKSYGADSPRPISLVKNNKGFWKPREWSTIIMGIVPAKVEIDDDL